jgi:hypothetical protein
LARSLVADIARESGGDIRWYPDLDCGELELVTSLWRDGSVRRLRAIVEQVIRYRERLPKH